MADTPAGFAPDSPTPNKAPASGRTKDWRGPQAGASRGKLLAVTLVLLGAVAGIILAVLLLLKDDTAEPSFTSIPLTRYSTAWPVRAWGEEDARRLAGIFANRFETPVNLQEAEAFQNWLKNDLKRGIGDKPQEQTQIIHLSGFASVQDGKVFLLLPQEQNQGVVAFPLESVLDAVNECKAGRKLLLLDLVHAVEEFPPPHRPASAAAIDAELKNPKNAGRWPYAILTSCGPGEHSLPCDPLGCSVFALYLEDGLRGAADGATGQERDRRVSLQELVRFVRGRTHRWAKGVCNLTQTPTLYPAIYADDFILAYNAQPRPDRYDPPAARPYPPKLEQEWKNLPPSAEPFDPDPRARRVTALLREEQEARHSGVAASAEQGGPPSPTEAKNAAPDSEWAMADADARGAVRRFRLPKAAPQPKLKEKLVAYVNAAVGGEDKALKDWQTDATGQSDAAAGVVWELAVVEPPTRATLKKWKRALEMLKVVSVETLLLERLADRDFQETTNLSAHPKEAIEALLAAEATLREALFVAPAGFGGVRAQYEAAERMRVEGEEKLFKAVNSAEMKKAAEILADVPALFKTATQLLQKRQATLAAERSARLALFDTLPSAVEFGGPDDLIPWTKWQEACKEVAAWRADPDRARVNPELGAELKRNFSEKPARRELEKSRTTHGQFARYTELLAGSALDVALRREVWNARDECMNNLHKSIRQKDQDDDQNPAAKVDEVAAPTALPAERGERRIEARRLLAALADPKRDGAAGRTADAADARAFHRWFLEQTAVLKPTRGRGAAAERFYDQATNALIEYRRLAPPENRIP